MLAEAFHYSEVILQSLLKKQMSAVQKKVHAMVCLHTVRLSFRPWWYGAKWLPGFTFVAVFTKDTSRHSLWLCFVLSNKIFSSLVLFRCTVCVLFKHLIRSWPIFDGG